MGDIFLRSRIFDPHVQALVGLSFALIKFLHVYIYTTTAHQGEQ